jgi:hypothetical protein
MSGYRIRMSRRELRTAVSVATKPKQLTNRIRDGSHDDAELSTIGSGCDTEKSEVELN